MPAFFGSDEFDCCECGRHIIVLCGTTAPLCAACLMLPGWHRDTRLRAVIDEDHDGQDPAGRNEHDDR
jgi:hypothetical protein